MQMKIAILGGNFDPPHLGHYLIALQVKEFLQMDQTWLMPLYHNTAHDTSFHKPLSDVEHRMNMAKVLENEFIKVSDFEIQHNPTSYTIDTLQQLEMLYPTDTFYWITGSDKLKSFQKYHQWEELLKMYNHIFFPREHMLWHLEEKVKEGLHLQTIPKNIIILGNKDLVLTNVSSSIIRQRVKNSLSIHYLVPQAIEDYIKEHKLYE